MLLPVTVAAAITVPATVAVVLAVPVTVAGEVVLGASVLLASGQVAQVPVTGCSRWWWR